MGQTLYAIIAMMIVSLFATQQQRHALKTQLAMIDNEIETIASGVAVERLEAVGSLAFDQNTTGGQVVTDDSQLTPPSGFGSGDGKDQPNDDMDDFHDSTQPLFRVISGDTLSFATSVTVDYVEESDLEQPVAYRTKFKLVTVTVSPVFEDGRFYAMPGLFEKEITLSQTYSCKSACQW